jgi:hypothetical protein
MGCDRGVSELVEEEEGEWNGRKRSFVSKMKYRFSLIN